MRRRARLLALAGMFCALLAGACGHVGPLVPPADGNGGEMSDDAGY